MVNTFAPTFIPQITDPKIIVQTFNAPNSPILPNTFPKPKVTLDVNLPAPVKPAAPIRIVHTSPGFDRNTKTFKELLEQDVVDAYVEALKEDSHMGHNSKIINIFGKGDEFADIPR